MYSIKKTFVILLCLILCVGLIPRADAEGTTQITGTGYNSFAFLTDQNIDKYIASKGNVSLTLTNPAGISSLYLMFDLEYGAYIITDNESGKTITAGQQGYLHEFVDLAQGFGTKPTSVTLDFSNGSVSLSEIYTFSDSEVPEFVQKWNAPLESGADIVLFATHGDDDQLFFAGLLPLYAGEKGYRVQVVYLTDHRNLTNARTHEMLNGLWSVGVTAYPVFGSFADFRIDDLEDSYAAYEKTYGTSRDELQSFVVAQLRRFKPMVAVGHDLKGEYGHGMHMVYADLLTKAIPLASDPAVFPESAEKYGTWELPKLYLHLYEENPIVIDYDQPLSVFDGMTAFEVTQKLGYPCHKSQQYTWFTSWINGKTAPITKASQIKTYNPCQFGLYHTTVGQDVARNDFMENIVTYAQQEQERLEQERLEQERLEQERLEQERLEQERLEQEKLEQERQEQAEQERQRLEQQQKQERLALQNARKQTIISIIVLCVLVITLFCVVRLFCKQGKKKNSP